MNQKLYRLITSNLDSVESYELRRYMLVNIFSMLATFTFGFFAYYNYFVTHHVIISMIDFIAMILAILTILSLRLTHNLKLGVFFTTLYFFIFFISFTHLNQNQNFGLIWNIFFTIAAINLNGHKKGLLYSLIFYAIVFSIAYNGIGVWMDGDWNMISFLRFSIALLVLTYVMYATEAALHSSHNNLKRLIEFDTLTKIYNRRKLNEILTQEIQKAHRFKTQLVVAIFDIDNFKLINDTYGHNTGDLVLVKLSMNVLGSIRQTDYFGRWGGEEFLLVLPNTTLEEGQIVLEKIRQRIEAIEFDTIPNLTCSFGMCAYAEGASEEECIAKADEALYRAKALGKNRVEIY